MRGAKWVNVTVAAAILATVLAGCASGISSGGGSGPSGSGTSGSGISGSGAPQSITGTWRLLNGTDSKGALSPGTATVTLTLDGAKSSGQGPCNAFGATASSSTTGSISIRVGIHTEMACAEAVLNTTETRYFAALGVVKTATIAKNELTLSGGNDTLVFARTGT